jgi:hypothetical protein
VADGVNHDGRNVTRRYIFFCLSQRSTVTVITWPDPVKILAVESKSNDAKSITVQSIRLFHCH